MPGLAAHLTLLHCPTFEEGAALTLPCILPATLGHPCNLCMVSTLSLMLSGLLQPSGGYCMHASSAPFQLWHLFYVAEWVHKLAETERCF